MAYKDLEKQRQYNKTYYLLHKEKILETTKAWRPTHKEKILENRQEHRREYWEREQQLKFAVFVHYSQDPPVCLHCGEQDIDVLTIDHVNNNGAEERKTLGIRTGKTVYRWLKTNDYPEGYQVLCANCNLKKEILRRRTKAYYRRLL